MSPRADGQRALSLAQRRSEAASCAALTASWRSACSCSLSLGVALQLLGGHQQARGGGLRLRSPRPTLQSAWAPRHAAPPLPLLSHPHVRRHPGLGIRDEIEGVVVDHPEVRRQRPSDRPRGPAGRSRSRSRGAGRATRRSGGCAPSRATAPAGNRRPCPPRPSRTRRRPPPAQDDGGQLAAAELAVAVDRGAQVTAPSHQAMLRTPDRAHAADDADLGVAPGRS